MLCSFRSQSSRYLSAATHVRRYSTPLDVISAPSQTNKADGALRPHLNVSVKPDHGLWAFFRQREKDGRLVYESVETEQGLFDKSGRSWSAAELRRKSFRDMHTLWYVLLRERNLLATQGAELRRLGIPSAALSVSSLRETQCRKSMARIKHVINERRLAYEGAVNKFAEEKDAVVKAERRARKASRRAERREQRKCAMETKKESTVSEAATLAADAILTS
ncbi:MRP-L47-domain-containing protein [Dentipellis sp. KUC8613]|nr:MRP-L47-domain-containing protein [Dentipellis sp. KUC8613]